MSVEWSRQVISIVADCFHVTLTTRFNIFRLRCLRCSRMHNVTNGPTGRWKKCHKPLSVTSSVEDCLEPNVQICFFQQFIWKMRALTISGDFIEPEPLCNWLIAPSCQIRFRVGHQGWNGQSHSKISPVFFTQINCSILNSASLLRVRRFVTEHWLIGTRCSRTNFLGLGGRCIKLYSSWSTSQKLWQLTRFSVAYFRCSVFIPPCTCHLSGAKV